MIQGLHILPGFVSAAEQTALLDAVDAEPWLSDLKRRTQHYGYKYDYTKKSINRQMQVRPLPGWSKPLTDQLLTKLIISKQPDQLIVNEYLPGQGITKHIDCVPCFEDEILSVSLGSPVTMLFSHRHFTATSGPRHIWLNPGDVLLLRGEARYGWAHEIPARTHDQGVARQRRVSLTFRRVTLED